jgi:vacuolar-type H+-ATPase subunit H
MIVPFLWFQFVAADSNTDQAKTGLQDIVSQVQSWVQSFRDRAEKAISDALANAQKFIQSLQDRFKDAQDTLTSAYSNDTSTASQVKACVQTGQQQADAVANSTSTYPNIINVFTAYSKYSLGQPSVYPAYKYPGVILRRSEGSQTKTHCAGKGHKQFSSQSFTQRPRREFRDSQSCVTAKCCHVMSPPGLGTKNCCAGESQQKFTQNRPSGLEVKLTTYLHQIPRLRIRLRWKYASPCHGA